MATWIQKGMKTKPKTFTHEELVSMVEMDEPRKSAVCKHCGTKNLQWLHYMDASDPYGTNFKWMLLEVRQDGLLMRHTCEQFKSMKENSNG